MGTRDKLESEFVHDLFIPALEAVFPGCVTLKQNPEFLQGVPDLLFLWRDHWGLFETKRGRKSVKQPNQEYYVDKFNRWSFAAFVNPDNYLEVIADMERVFC